MDSLLKIKMGRNESATKFQDRSKVEYSSAKAVSGKFPIGSTALDSILEEKGKDFAAYCKMSDTEQKEVEQKADQL